MSRSAAIFEFSTTNPNISLNVEVECRHVVLLSWSLSNCFVVLRTFLFLLLNAKLKTIKSDFTYKVDLFISSIAYDNQQSFEDNKLAIDVCEKRGLVYDQTRHSSSTRRGSFTCISTFEGSQCSIITSAKIKIQSVLEQVQKHNLHVNT